MNISQLATLLAVFTGVIPNHTFGFAKAMDSDTQAVLLEMEAEAETARRYAKLVVIHGVLMVIVWGLVVPVAIGASLLRDILPTGAWMRLHKGLSLFGLVCVAIGFSTIVARIHFIPFEYPHFRATTHSVVGFLVCIFFVMQVIIGICRPVLPSPPPEGPTMSDPENGQSDGTKEHGRIHKSAGRIAFEVGHRIFGVTVLAMAWYSIHSGIKIYASRTGDDWSAIVWPIIAVTTGTIVLLHACQLIRKRAVALGRSVNV